jgi:hypothetical protein
MIGSIIAIVLLASLALLEQCYGLGSSRSLRGNEDREL